MSSKLSASSANFIRFAIDILDRPNFYAYLFQFLALAALVAIIWVAADNAIAHLTKQNIATGFDFLNEAAGFDISQTLIEYSNNSTYERVLLVGLLNTLLVSVIGIVFATVLGFIIGIARLSSNVLVSKLATIYVETVRNIPLLLQIFFWYFAVFSSFPPPKQSFALMDAVFINNRGFFLPRLHFEPAMLWVGIVLLLGIIGVLILQHMSDRHRQATGESLPVLRWSLLMLCLPPVLVFFATGEPVSLSLPELRGFNFQGGLQVNPEFSALLLALSIYTAAFIAEIVRAGIGSVKRGQVEAGLSLGLHRNSVLRKIIIPQAMRVIIPPLTSQYLNLIKNSSLAVAIAYPDLVSVFAGTALNQTGQALEIIFITLSVYLGLSLSTSWAMNVYNRRLLSRGGVAA